MTTLTSTLRPILRRLSFPAFPHHLAQAGMTDVPAGYVVYTPVHPDLTLRLIPAAIHAAAQEIVARRLRRTRRAAAARQRAERRAALATALASAEAWDARTPEWACGGHAHAVAHRAALVAAVDGASRDPRTAILDVAARALSELVPEIAERRAAHLAAAAAVDATLAAEDAAWRTGRPVAWAISTPGAPYHGRTSDRASAWNRVHGAAEIYGHVAYVQLVEIRSVAGGGEMARVVAEVERATRAVLSPAEAAGYLPR